MGTLVAIGLLGGAAIAAALVALAARGRPGAPGAPALAVLMAAVALWSAVYALEVVAPTGAAKLWWARVEYVGIAAVPYAWLAFAFAYSRPAGAPPWWLALLAIVPAMTVLLFWTNDAHGLVWRTIDLTGATAGRELRVVAYGPWFWLHAAAAYTALAIGTARLAATLAHTSRPIRRQAPALAVGIAAPWLANILHLAGVQPLPGIDLTPVAFAVTGATFGWGLVVRGRLLEIAASVIPLAREAVLDGMADAVLALDAGGRLVDLNPAGAALLGQPTGALLGRPLAALAPELAALDPAGGDLTLGGGRIYDARVSPLVWGGRPAGRVLVLRDVTELRASQTQLAQAGKLAAIGTLAAGVAHELNQPLQVVRGRAQIMLGEPDVPDAWRRHLTQIERQSERMAAIIDHLRAFGRADAPAARPIDLNQVVEDALLLVGANLREHGIGLVLDLAAPRPLALADANQVEQIVLNLLVNARDAAPAGGTVLVQTWRDAAGCRLRVADDGPGLPPAVLARLFEPFFTTKPVGRGTGLGLAISRDLARKWGGDLTLANRADGPGAIAELTLPAAPEATPALPAAD
jgi:signal transduction histidine kinase